MQPDSDDDAWRAIIENYGDRADLGAEESPTQPTDSPDLARAEPDDSAGDWTPAPTGPDAFWAEERYVPPPPPPLPRVAPDRLVAWSGVFGSPTILLFCLILDIHLPRLVGYALVAGFVGGFLYLVSQMPSGPRDPTDDGARL